MNPAFFVRLVEGRSCPQTRCERCGRDIDFAMAGVVWTGLTNDATESTIIVLCKTRRCLSAPEYKLLPWMDLTRFLLHALHNGGLPSKKLRATIKRNDDRYKKVGF